MKKLYGIGINDADYQVSFIDDIGKKIKCPYYKVWTNMFSRCYAKSVKSRQSAYDGCSVDTRWHKFSDFKLWMKSQDWKGKHLDKDILVYGNKIYSPDTCIFVSRDVNNLMVGKSKGYSYHKATGKYSSFISINGKNNHIGYFDDEISAREAYVQAKISRIMSLIPDFDERVKSAMKRIVINELLPEVGL